MSQPLLTHVIVGRNDNYLGNFKHRLELAVNYTCNSVAQSGNLDNYELLLVDWNSESPLREALNLNEHARRCTFFLEVPPAVVRQNKPSDSVINMAVALNVGVRRARGRMIMFSPSDALFPYSSMRALYDLLEGRTPFATDLDTCYLGIERFLIPWQTSERLTKDTVERLLVMHQTGFQLAPRVSGISGGEGAQLISSKLINEIQGFDESYIYWGGSDCEIVLRINQRYPYLKLTHFGVFCYDLSQPQAVRADAIKKTNTVRRLPLESKVNDDFWGLGNLTIEKQPALECPDIDNTPDNRPSPYDLAVTGRMYTPDLLRKIGILWNSILRQGCLAKIALWLAPYHISMYRKNQEKCLYNKLHTVLCFLAFKSLLAKWMDCPQKDNSEYFFSAWFGDKKALKNYFEAAFDQRLFLRRSKWSVVDASALIALVATMGRQQPLRFLYCPRREQFIAYAAVFIEPTMEITGYDHWLQEDRNPGNIGGILMESGFMGHYHTLSGAPETLFERLQQGQYICEPYQCVYLDLDFLGNNFPEDISQITPLLDTSCTVIFKGNSGALSVWESEFPAQGFALVGKMPGISIWARSESLDRNN